MRGLENMKEEENVCNKSKHPCIATNSAVNIELVHNTRFFSLLFIILILSFSINEQYFVDHEHKS